MVAGIMGNSFACGTTKPMRKFHSIRWNEKLDKTVPSGETLLTIAVQMDLQDLVLLLLKEGASVNQQNISGNTPLHVAIRARNESILSILIRHGANVNARDRCGLTPLHLACIIQNTYIVERLLEAGAKPDGIQDGKFYVSTPLMTAAENNDVLAAKSLICSGADVNVKDWWQNTALLKAVQIGSRELVTLLLEHKANPNVVNRFGGNSLHYAVVANHCDIMRVLIEAGCSINSSGSQAKDSTVRYSPLAAAIHRNCLRCFNYLIRCGATFDTQDTQHKTPLVYALTNRAWDCLQKGHSRNIPTCLHVSPPFIDSERVVFAERLLFLGASVYFAWDTVIWQIRHHFLRPEDRDGLLLCIRAAGFLSLRDFKVETFYRVLSLSGHWRPLWYLIQAGYTPNDEECAMATSARRFDRNVFIRQDALESDYDPVRWLTECLTRRPRSLKNLALLEVRRNLQKNVLYGVSHLPHVPKPLKDLITLNHEYTLENQRYQTA
ncbi:hypothetical protein LSH36_7g00013 [Paralvinella palmiformis]|uniref:Uncharacterized protein n=1 Tax=Paralvinella palmiformis TaxID=53620 RepID=A0AAD9KE72_9ANNE|nr:hypothetical protein LSH36_7g00013 [Paralvinella palmiformis]